MHTESLKKSLDTLIQAYNEYRLNTENKIVRDAVVKRYEYTYETALKMIKRQLSETILSQENINTLSFNNFIRTANDAELLSNPLEQWQRYRDQRNSTVHVYDEGKAEELLSVLPDFISEIDFLLKQLNKYDE